MTAPKRIQLRRSSGWRLARASTNPNGVVIVDRRRGNPWGNPYVIRQEWYGGWIVFDVRTNQRKVECDDESYARRVSVGLHSADLEAGRLSVTVEDVKRDLGGKDIACWCGLSDLCHGDTYLDVANRQAS